MSTFQAHPTESSSRSNATERDWSVACLVVQTRFHAAARVITGVKNCALEPNSDIGRGVEHSIWRGRSEPKGKALESVVPWILNNNLPTIHHR